MNQFEFAEKFRLSLSKVKQMHKAGYLRLDDDRVQRFSDYGRALRYCAIEAIREFKGA